MKKHLLVTLLCISAIFGATTKGGAQTTTITYWDFNSWTSTVTLPAIATIPATHSVVSAPSNFVYQTIPGTSSSFSDYCDFYATTPADLDTANLQPGDTSGNAFRARNPSDSMEILLYMPTTSCSHLTLKYDCEKSSDASGDSMNVFAYSIDSGAHWITSGTGLSEWADSGTVTFRLITVNINDTMANNNPRFVFRITTLGKNSGTGGNNRYDNISLSGVTTAVNHTGINNTTLNNAEYNIFPNPVTNTLNVTSSINGEKSAVIYDIVGNTVRTEKYNGNNLMLNTSSLNAGMYLISITEETTGQVTTKKFIKQ